MAISMSTLVRRNPGQTGKKGGQRRQFSELYSQVMASARERATENGALPGCDRVPFVLALIGDGLVSAHHVRRGRCHGERETGVLLNDLVAHAKQFGEVELVVKGNVPKQRRLCVKARDSQWHTLVSTTGESLLDRREVMALWLTLSKGVPKGYGVTLSDCGILLETSEVFGVLQDVVSPGRLSLVSNS